MPSIFRRRKIDVRYWMLPGPQLPRLLAALPETWPRTTPSRSGQRASSPSRFTSERPLLAAHGEHGIDARGAPRRHIAGHERERDQKQRDLAEGDCVGGVDAVEEALEQPRQAERRAEAEPHADPGQLE